MTNNINKNLINTYNRIAEDWNNLIKDTTWWQTGLNKFAELFKPGSTILDVGCGSGQKTKYLKSKGLEVSGCDISEKMVEIANRDAPDIEFFVMDLYDLPDLKKTYDGLLLHAVLLHIPKKDVPKMLQNFKDKLNPNGYIYVMVKELRPGEKDEQTIKQNNHGYDYERFFSFYTVSELEKFLTETGFKIISNNNFREDDGTNWIQVIAQKQ